MEDAEIKQENPCSSGGPINNTISVLDSDDDDVPDLVEQDGEDTVNIQSFHYSRRIDQYLWIREWLNPNYFVMTPS
jgi:hypothetical protein